MTETTPDIQSAAALTRLIETARAVHLGIALGEAADQLTSTAPVRRSGVATQLTLATTEAVIRCMEKGGQHLPFDWEQETLASLGRWGIAQGIEGVITPREGATPSFLSALPAYAERRGNAPATVRRLKQLVPPGQTEVSEKGSLGPHAMIRTLPIGAVLPLDGGALTDIAATCARATHSHPAAIGSAVAAVNLVAAATQGAHVDLAGAWLEVINGLFGDGHVLRERFGAAISAAVVEPHDPQVLARIAPDRTAPSVLSAAIYAVLCHPEPDRFHLAMGLAGFSKDPSSASAVTGGLLGARYGSTPLLAYGAGRLDLAWACEALGTDLAMTAMLTPLGREPSGESWLPSWADRYAVGQVER